MLCIRSYLKNLYTLCTYILYIPQLPHEPIPQHLLLCLPHRFHFIQYDRVGVQENAQMASYNHVAYGGVVVHSGYLVWLGLLSLHRLALEGSGSHGLSRPLRFIYTFPGLPADRYQYGPGAGGEYHPVDFLRLLRTHCCSQYKRQAGPDPAFGVIIRIST